MGIIADFVVAKHEDALRYATVQGERQLLRNQFEQAEYKNFTSLHLEVFWAILRKEKWEPRQHHLEHVSHKEGGEEWLFRFPDNFVSLLATLDGKAVKQAAADWANSEEMRTNAEELEPILQDIVRLASIAQESHRGLYLWGSL